MLAVLNLVPVRGGPHKQIPQTLHQEALIDGTVPVVNI